MLNQFEELKERLVDEEPGQEVPEQLVDNAQELIDEYESLLHATNLSSLWRDTIPYYKSDPREVPAILFNENKRLRDAWDELGALYKGTTAWVFEHKAARAERQAEETPATELDR